MIKTYHKNFVSGSPFIESRDFLNGTQMHSTSFDWFSMDLPLFLGEVFRFVFTCKKKGVVLFSEIFV